MLDTIETRKLDPTALVDETVDIHQVPDELAAMSEYNTLRIPVCTEFGSRLARAGFVPSTVLRFDA